MCSSSGESLRTRSQSKSQRADSTSHNNHIFYGDRSAATALGASSTTMTRTARGAVGRARATRGNNQHDAPDNELASEQKVMGSNASPLTHWRGLLPMRAVLFVSVVLASISACAGWVISSGGSLARMTDVLGKVPFYLGNAFKQECRAVPPWDADQSEMRRAVTTFEARDYAPPIWARNAHLHTIVASGDMEKKILGDRAPLGYWRERWPTPDGDFVDIDWLPAEKHDVADQASNGLDRGSSGPSPGAEEMFNFDIDGDVEGQEEQEEEQDSKDSAKSTAVGGSEEAAMEQLREAAALAARAHGASLGLGHPQAPEPVHLEHPSWMTERREGKGGQGTGGTRRLIVLLHGLEGSSTAPLTKRFSSVYSRNGFDVAAVNFRGCSGELSKYPLGYHLGFTDDLLHVVQEIHRRFPDTWDRLYLSGFSLGGNVIVKFLGEQGDRARDLGIYGAAVGCVPFEPQLGAEKLDKDPIGRYLYMPVFLAWLTFKAAEHAKAHPDKLNLEDVQGVKTFAEFDSRITLPVFGFSSPKEYYDYVNAANYLSKVRVPLMVINAKDDPFIEGDSLPEQERVGDAPVRLVYHDYGGHCGFMSGMPSNQKSGNKWATWGGKWIPWGSASSSSASGNDQTGERSDTKTHVTADTEISEIVETGASAAVAATVAAASASASASGADWSNDAGGIGVSDTGGGVEGGAGEEMEVGVGGTGDGGEGGSRTLKEGRWLPTELARFVEHLDSSLHRDGKSERRRRARHEGAAAASCVPMPSLKS